LDSRFAGAVVVIVIVVSVSVALPLNCILSGRAFLPFAFWL